MNGCSDRSGPASAAHEKFRMFPVTGDPPTPEGRGRHLRALAVLLLVLCLFVGLIVYWAFFEREHHQWSEVVRLWDGSTLQLQRYSSKRVSHGPHGFVFGGGHPWGSVTFEAGGRAYRWEGPYDPIAVQLDRTGVYIVVFDRETDFNHLSFRLYRASSPSEWEEITREQFPKHLAIQNTWLHRNPDMDPNSNRFRESLTARLWSYLDEEDFDYNTIPSNVFLQEFKTKWICPESKR